MTDHLGSLVGTLSSTGTVVSTEDVAPFGEIFAGGSSDPFVFTGKERDAESGNDYFGARYNSSNMGRWMSPDWASHPEAVPYTSLSNPQSLNLYAYVGNNPLGRIDADGHEGEDCPDAGCSRFMSSEWAGSLAHAFPNGVPAMLMFEPPAQQPSGSSGGNGFWSHVSNLLHEHSWNYEMRESVTVTVVPVVPVVPASNPNPYFPLLGDGLGVVGQVSGYPILGFGGQGINLANNPHNGMNWLVNGMSLVPEVGPAIGAASVVGDVGMALGQWGTNNVMAPMIDAIPGNTMNDGYGQSVQNPAQMDEGDPAIWGAPQ